MITFMVAVSPMDDFSEAVQTDRWESDCDGIPVNSGPSSLVNRGNFPSVCSNVCHCSGPFCLFTSDVSDQPDYEQSAERFAKALKRRTMNLILS
jgi:hypothetical protein